MKIFISNNSLYFNEINYIFSLFAFNKGLNYRFVQDESDADLIISDKSNADIRVSLSFYQQLYSGVYSHKNYFISNCEYIDDGFVDYLSSAFYIINVIQELNDTDDDDDNFGRFKYSNSFQKKFDNVRVNIVQDLFDKLWSKTPKFANLKCTSSRTKIYLSHDIDTINGSIIQDSFYCIKKLQPARLFKVFFENVFLKPAWFNMDKIMKIESDFDFTSTFYWLVNKGKTEYGLSNSDYKINSQRVVDIISSIDKTKWENSLHKSASKDSFSTELSRIPVKVKGNRYHYIRFKPHENFIDIEAAGLEMDSSLGFADAPGFRNGYGMPFQPYNFKSKKSYGFVEAPLNIMDTTYFNYLKVGSDEFVKDVKSFLESNSTNSVISVLFHNNFISEVKYGHYYKAFKELLSYFYESDFKSVSQSEIIAQYKNGYSNKVNE